LASACYRNIYDNRWLLQASKSNSLAKRQERYFSK
jgi:hypothetical protein